MVLNVFGRIVSYILAFLLTIFQFQLFLSVRRQGSGKTLAFAIPLIHHILTDKEADSRGGDAAETDNDEASDTSDGNGSQSDCVWSHHPTALCLYDPICLGIKSCLG